MALELKGECEIGGSINVRTEKHGDENVTAMDIPFSILIKGKTLIKLLREDLAITALFNEKEPGHFEPLFGGKIGMIPLLGKFPDSQASFKCGVNEIPIDFDNCTVAKIKFDPQIGGMTLIKGMIQTEMHESQKAIFDFAGSSWPAVIKLGKLKDVAKEDQMNLPMGPPADGGDADDAPSGALDEALAKDDAEQKTAEAQPGYKVTKNAKTPAEPKAKRERPSRSKAAKAARAAAKE